MNKNEIWSHGPEDGRPVVIVPAELSPGVTNDGMNVFLKSLQQTIEERGGTVVTNELHLLSLFAQNMTGLFEDLMSRNADGSLLHMQLVMAHATMLGMQRFIHTLKEVDSDG